MYISNWLEVVMLYMQILFWYSTLAPHVRPPPVHIGLPIAVTRPFILFPPGNASTPVNRNSGLAYPVHYSLVHNPSLWLAVIPVILYDRPTPPACRGWRPVKSISGAPTARHSFWDYLVQRYTAGAWMLSKIVVFFFLFFTVKIYNSPDCERSQTPVLLPMYLYTTRMHIELLAVY